MTEPEHQTAAAPLRVTIQDLRAARYCLAGVRPWFRRHGLDWQDFLDRGIEVERLRATGDALVEPVITQAVAREATQARTREAEAQVTAQAMPSMETSDGR